MLHIIPLKTLEEAYALASIRNQCRLMMTNDQSEIDLSSQRKWFESFYAKQNPIQYRVWLLKEHENVIGYFAAKETNDGYYITEGLDENKRGKGAGSFLLKSLLSEKFFISKPILADIYDHNLPSIHLHLKFGFEKFDTIKKDVSRYILRLKQC